VKKLEFEKQKTQRKLLGKTLVNDRIEEQNKSPKNLISLIFPKP